MSTLIMEQAEIPAVGSNTATHESQLEIEQVPIAPVLTIEGTKDTYDFKTLKPQELKRGESSFAESTATVADSDDSCLEENGSLSNTNCTTEKRSSMIIETQAQSLLHDEIFHRDGKKIAIENVPSDITDEESPVPEVESTEVSSHISVERLSLETKTVRFDTVEIREYAYALGCNPGGTNGPPVTIDWDLQSSSIVPVDEYEQVRGPLRRPILNLRTTKEERIRLLKESGYESEELLRAELCAEEIRLNRQDSAKAKSDLQDLILESKRRANDLAATKRQGRKLWITGLFRKRDKKMHPVAFI